MKHLAERATPAATTTLALTVSLTALTATDTSAINQVD